MKGKEVVSQEGQCSYDCHLLASLVGYRWVARGARGASLSNLSFIYVQRGYFLISFISGSCLIRQEGDFTEKMTSLILSLMCLLTD